jgi:MHS family proline/betaine transporter-like MFS transporter
MVEWASPGKRGFYGSLRESSSTSGFLLGSVTVALIAMSVSPASMAAWGWRIPFFIGSLIGPLGLYMSRYVDETPAFKQLDKTRGRLALPTERSPWLLVARAFGFTVLWTVAYYIFLVYMPTFTRTYAHLSQGQALWSNAVGLIAMIVAMPLVGRLSDRVGRKPLLLASCVCFFVLPYPIFSMLLSGASLAEIMVAQIVFGVALALFAGIAPAAIAEIFPTHSRSTLMSIGYAISVAIFGGFAPFIATWLIAVSGIPIAPVFYVMAAAVVGAIVVWRMQETAHEALR